MSDVVLKQRFTPQQIHKLNTSGFLNLYSLVTYLPFDIIKIKPLLNINILPVPGQTYLCTARLERITHRNGKQRFVILDFKGKFELKCYLFSIASYTFRVLQIEQEYQLLLTYNSSGFWTLQRFAQLKEVVSLQKNLVLGQAVEKEYLVPKYAKTHNLKNSDFQNLHKKLLPLDYILNLSGLIPQNPVLPQVIDLSQIHKPVNLENYNKAYQSWITLKVYLRLVLLKYVDQTNQETFSKSGKLELEFLKKLYTKLPFELSKSQKLVLWEILQEVTEVH